MPGIFPSIEQRKKRIYNLERERDGKRMASKPHINI